MERRASARTGRIGITRVSLAVEEKLGWLFREQVADDFGIDAHIEIVDGTSVTGRLIALQVKSGLSYFEEPGTDGWWFRPDKKHVDYWLRHSLPVAVVLYHPGNEECYWALISKGGVQQSTSGHPKVWIPADHVLDAGAASALRAAADGDPYELRLRELQLAMPWIRRLAQGQRLVIDIAEWINKYSGRGSIVLGIDHEQGEQPEPLVEWNVFLGLESYAEVVPRMFAWADVCMHEETNDTYADDELEWENYVYDEDAGKMVHHRDAEWQANSRSTGLRPYKNGAGEVDFWRLELKLNALGRAYMAVDAFATTGVMQLSP